MDDESEKSFKIVLIVTMIILTLLGLPMLISIL